MRWQFFLLFRNQILKNGRFDHRDARVRDTYEEMLSRDHQYRAAAAQSLHARGSQVLLTYLVLMILLAHTYLGLIQGNLRDAVPEVSFQFPCGVWIITLHQAVVPPRNLVRFRVDR